MRSRSGKPTDSKFLVGALLCVLALIFFALYFIGNSNSNDVVKPPIVIAEPVTNPEEIRSRAASLVKLRRDFEKKVDTSQNSVVESKCSKLTQHQQVCNNFNHFFQNFNTRKIQKSYWILSVHLFG